VVEEDNKADEILISDTIETREGRPLCKMVGCNRRGRDHEQGMCSRHHIVTRGKALWAVVRTIIPGGASSSQADVADANATSIQLLNYEGQACVFNRCPKLRSNGCNGFCSAYFLHPASASACVDMRTLEKKRKHDEIIAEQNKIGRTKNSPKRSRMTKF